MTHDGCICIHVCKFTYTRYIAEISAANTPDYWVQFNQLTPRYDDRQFEDVLKFIFL